METIKIFDTELAVGKSAGKYWLAKAPLQNVMAQVSGKKILVHNFANNEIPCAGPYKGNTREDIIFRNSNIAETLTPNFYPIGGEVYRLPNGTIHIPQTCSALLSRNVFLFSINVDVISIAAQKAPKLYYNDYYYADEKEFMARKIRLITSIAKDYDYLISGAWGSGAFGNPPKIVASLWKCHNMGANIIFAIPDVKLLAEYSKVF